MDIFSVISFLGGLALFLYGMAVLADSVETLAGGRFETILENITKNIFTAVLFGALVTAAVQSSSAVTVIVVGLINAKALKLKNAIGVIMGANIGTTVTGQILRMSEISGTGFFLQLLKPTALAPLAAVIGILVFMNAKRTGAKQMGTVLLGFAILFIGMFNMEAAVKPLRELPQFAEIFATLSNPFLGVLAGALITAVIQSSSASIGILQALSVTGEITCSSAFPIIMGQNIGTCITPILASIGASRNAKRSAVVHLSFNVAGTAIFLIGIYSIQHFIGIPFWHEPITKGGIADFHTMFNVIVTLIFIPFTGVLDKLAHLVIRDKGDETAILDESILLEERLLVTPSLAIEQARKATYALADQVQVMLEETRSLAEEYDPKGAARIREQEDAVDRIESRVSDYLLKLRESEIPDSLRNIQRELLHTISELEQAADNVNNIVDALEEVYDKKLSFSPSARSELERLFAAANEMIAFTNQELKHNRSDRIGTIEAYEKIIDIMEENFRSHHIARLQKGACTGHTAFPFVTIIDQMTRIADNFSNIGVGLMVFKKGNSFINRHEMMNRIHEDGMEGMEESFKELSLKYLKPVILPEHLAQGAAECSPCQG
ncbi:MAG: Na/Pi cotransporter family protein [Peptococcaceae bacterium]|nr:Na/Pi cotransporter family protein [Peptococcaceae bacterium]